MYEIYRVSRTVVNGSKPVTFVGRFQNPEEVLTVCAVLVKTDDLTPRRWPTLETLRQYAEDVRRHMEGEIDTGVTPDGKVEIS